MSWKTGTIADFMGDRVVYRNLEPMQPGLDGLRRAWAEIGLDHYYVPRKTTPEYARALWSFLQQCQSQRGVSAALQQLLFIGDTLMLDGTAARNVGRYLPLHGFIGADRLNQEPKVELQGDLLVANRWGALAQFLDWARTSGVPMDERTALLIDLDKTSLGARGRNDKTIDEARVQALYATMRAALGDSPDSGAFRQLYDALNVPQYHSFTADNQDYLAYVCLMVVGGVYPADELWRDLGSKDLATIDQFVERCEARRATMRGGLLQAHQEVHQGIKAEDPTPFKAFRRREYLETVSRMNILADEPAVDEVLRREIVITAEVASVARALGERGVLVFGISDKPDEASLPTAERAAQGYRALHRTTMKLYGQEIGL
jgi:hypothetical protein